MKALKYLLPVIGLVSFQVASAIPATWDFSDTHFTLSGILYCNCDGNGVPGYSVPPIMPITQFAYDGTCADGFCTATLTINGINHIDPGISIIVPPYVCLVGVDITAHDNSGHTWPHACTGSGDCPTGTYTITSWTGVPVFTDCIVGTGGGGTGQ